MQTLAYVRVSSIDQNDARQLDALPDHDKLFTDKCSGGSTRRPALEALRTHARAGDTIIVHSIDRLARNLGDLVSLVTEFNDNGIAVRFVKQGLMFDPNVNDALQRLQLHILGSVAEFERAMIRERQREGVDAARKRGVKFGRKPGLTAEQRASIPALRESMSVAQVAAHLNVSRQTIYSAIKTNP